MGQSQSKIDEIVRSVMPVYYIKNAKVEAEDIRNARHCWNLILTDESPGFVEYKEMKGSDSCTCLQWFYDSFYERLFDVHPSCRPQFKNNMQTQGKALVHMISAALSLLDDVPNLASALQRLARTHHARGVLGVQYGVVGETLIWTLSKCLGSEFNSAMVHSWLKIYSLMLKVIIPIAVEEELKASRQSQKASSKDFFFVRASPTALTKVNPVLSPSSEAPSSAPAAASKPPTLAAQQTTQAAQLKVDQQMHASAVTRN